MSKPVSVSSGGELRGGLGSSEELKVFKALSHETRIRILELLSEGELTVSELTAEFDLAQPSISRHLAILKNAALVRRQRAGQCVYYGLDAEELHRSLHTFVARFRRRELEPGDEARPGRPTRRSRTLRGAARELWLNGPN